MPIKQLPFTRTKPHLKEMKYSVGQKLSKRFISEESDTERSFSGQITDYDKETKLYKIVYEDDDTEELSEGEIEMLLKRKEIPIAAVQVSKREKNPIVESSTTLEKAILSATDIQECDAIGENLNRLLKKLAQKKAELKREKKKRRWKNAPRCNCGKGSSSYCASCEVEKCTKCLKECTSCERENCSKCFKECSDCGEVKCIKCFEECTGCNENKGKTVKCTDCMKRCWICEDGRCQDCIKLCEECGYSFCMDCAAECDCYEGLLCNACTTKADHNKICVFRRC
ncbi:hypothetical protein HJC23_013590 [Cyclotella cryptica]|uniref:PTM/DIR17-like Tudor domain-containing protein n=1 Tax=Cyclotella cryptica TaxID=29204 RepID=A0ABD3PQH4_9STRA|eukprot:CCRYP_012314-RA/>CCRYP_012314-RA protein AED:0.23 eAED:0.23 QI:0/-1/0/1/-1/1/1/0/283